MFVSSYIRHTYTGHRHSFSSQTLYTVHISNVTFDSLPPNVVSWCPRGVFHGFVAISDTCAEVVKLLLQLCCGAMHPLPEWAVRENREKWPPERCSDLFEYCQWSSIWWDENSQRVIGTSYSRILDPPQRVTLW